MLTPQKAQIMRAFTASTCWVVVDTEQQLERVQSEIKRQGTQLQEANSQLARAKQALQESSESLKASQKAAEYVALSRDSF